MPLQVAGNFHGAYEIITFGRPGRSLSVKVATWYCNIFISSAMICAAAPFCSFLRNWLLIFTMSDNLCVKSSCKKSRNKFKPGGF